MRTALSLVYDHGEPLPDGFDGADVRMPPVLVRRLLSEYTDRDDRLLDPFAGFGTTLAVAEGLDRRAWGVEYDADRVGYARDRLRDPDRLHHGTATDIPADVPTLDCVLTSPPYMHESDTRDPLQNYDGESDYGTYLEELSRVFSDIGHRFHRDGTLLVEVANLKHDGRTTTFAWDLAGSLRELPGFRFAGEHVVSWENGDDAEVGVYGYGYDHSYVLVFERA
ncbi:DNA methyltransferase [Haloglomus litoreum]|uniref:DNA methyltransferase n=1 Tax=Haloglomus litoreum TaxID=3034026 RepID=UPI0023E86148|nr:DNA methyltransferase [Haloglomus sp. DT116]